MGCIVRGYADLDAVPDHYLDSMFFHSSGQHAFDRDIVVTLDFHGASTQDLDDRTI